MTTRTLTTAATLVTAAGLLLTGCGSGSGSNQSSGPIKGAQSAAPSSAAPSASSSVPRPQITLPSDLHLRFEGDKTGDPTKDAVLYDNEQFIEATHQAIARSNPNDKAYQFYSEGTAGADTYNWIKTFVDAGMRSTGTARYYDREVTIGSGGWATISYCEDESKAYGKDLKTGKVDVTPVTKNSYVYYAGSVKRNSEGIWVAEQMTSQRGAAKCQP
ncbi:hypothetical protein NGB36_08970 [Streptomyces sp. RB6PN25]|uniref:Lipoprotein n=1 Tax=Streptomyces humicola TaxID=2953240 RepID=A0ABT1PSS6_9ACTN|nr:hypothetical protein [Streptomyces humicola]MCQ4080731.1 hypothetical protein [Streptomyces humicola]